MSGMCSVTVVVEIHEKQVDRNITYNLGKQKNRSQSIGILRHDYLCLVPQFPGKRTYNSSAVKAEVGRSLSLWLAMVGKFMTSRFSETHYLKKINK